MKPLLLGLFIATVLFLPTGLIASASGPRYECSLNGSVITDLRARDAKKLEHFAGYTCVRLP